MSKERLLRSLTVAALFGIGSSCGGSARTSGAPSGVGGGVDFGGSSAGTAGTHTETGGSANHAGEGGAAGQVALGGADGGGGAGSGGQSSAGGKSVAGAAGQASNSPCVKPGGADAMVQDYTLPVAGGCSFKPTTGQGSLTLVSEAAFLDFFRCRAGASAGVDFSTHRLHVTIVPSTTATPLKWAVDTTDAIHLGFSPAPSCGGPVSPTQFTMTLVPAGTEVIVEDLCTPACNTGAGGYPN